MSDYSTVAAGASAIFASQIQFSHSPLGSLSDSSLPDVKKKVGLLWNLGIIFISVHLFINVFFTSVIVRKILRSIAHRYEVTSARGRLWTVTVLLVESCSLYLIVWIVLIACALAKLPNFTVIHSVLVQVAGIAPTLLIVRANTRKEENWDDYGGYCNTGSTSPNGSQQDF
ncbi:hypothetical protein PM082_009586 [Marasmius tenuissimus]|nr:hypothetical protein PM082_009586 [Marasmius tenuissimus]